MDETSEQLTDDRLAELIELAEDQLVMWSDDEQAETVAALRELVARRAADPTPEQRALMQDAKELGRCVRAQRELRDRKASHRCEDPYGDGSDWPPGSTCWQRHENEEDRCAGCKASLKVHRELRAQRRRQSALLARLAAHFGRLALEEK